MLYFCIMLVNTISVIKQRKLDTIFFDFFKGLAQQTRKLRLKELCHEIQPN